MTEMGCVGAEGIRVYEELLTCPGLTADELGRRLHLAPPEVRRRLDRLHASGLAGSTVANGGDDAGWEARQPPDGVDTALAEQERRAAELRDAYRTVRTLNEVYWRHRDVRHYDSLEVIYEPAQISELVRRLQEEATVQVRAFMRPPYYTLSSPESLRRQSARQRERIQEGITYRAVWESDSWDDPEAAATLLENIRDGEQARQLPSLPTKLYLVDDQRAVMPLDQTRHSDHATLVVHPSGLLAALGTMFEHYWDHAIPIRADGAVLETAGFSDRERDVMVLLASGASDEVVARRLGVSRSTVTRLVAALETRLGVSSRFQLGAEAVRRGYL